MTFLDLAAYDCPIQMAKAPLVKSAGIESPHDLLLWEDGFWSFREEFCEQWLRAHDYRVVVRNSEEWLRITAQPPP